MFKCIPFFKRKAGRIESNQKSPTTSAPTSPLSYNGNFNSKSAASASSPRSIPALYEERGHILRAFGLRELIAATNGFNRQLKIGEGGFGSVYKGFMKPPSGQGDRLVVAVKKLNPNGLQGHKQWLAEVQLLGVVEHPNLVKLIGYCAVDGEKGIARLLVYEFMPNKTLDDHLFNKAYPVLPWNTRLHIALGAAQGLAYLHEGSDIPVVIYRDFKASNVLLDNDFKPKLSDFGLAREGPSVGRTHVTTAVVGTYGYAAPDYIQTGHLTTKSDIWSFGVVLYEILTGRRSLEKARPRAERKLLEWVKQFPVDGRRFYMIMDPRLGKQFSLPAARLIARLADRCLSNNPKDRPTMNEVVEFLKEAIQVTEKGVPAEPAEERTSTDSESEKQEQIPVSESLKRRMDHLAKMRENLATGSRKGLLETDGANGT